MKPYIEMTKTELESEIESLKGEYKKYQDKNLKLNMARGKPGSDQLELSMPMLDVLNSSSDCKDKTGLDCRNYGALDGIADAKELFSEYMGVSPDEIIVVGSSSLTFMYDCIARAMLKGVSNSDKPWCKYEEIKFICPVPGYDRHFSICEFLGIKMISVGMDENGPDMDTVEKLVSEDDTIKGMWCVPKYSNPTGITYSDEVIKRIASLKPAAKDFRVFCDNAYAAHHVYKDTSLLNILEEFKKAGNPDMIYLFGSTSKITFPGAGVAFFVASKDNVKFTVEQISMQAIGWDKMNMLRHVRFFKDLDGIKEIMNKHAELLKVKFDVVLNYFESELSDSKSGKWIKPDGGYFITYIAEKGCAKKIVSLCKDAGVVLTGAGAMHPYGKDPDDSYIRIAPTFPDVDELEEAMKIFCVSAKLASAEKCLELKV